MIQCGDNLVTRVMGDKTTHRKNRLREAGKNKGRRCGMASYLEKKPRLRISLHRAVYEMFGFSESFPIFKAPIRTPRNPRAERAQLEPA
jgi:hypothetical protein